MRFGAASGRVAALIGLVAILLAGLAAFKLATMGVNSRNELITKILQHRATAFAMVFVIMPGGAALLFGTFVGWLYSKRLGAWAALATLFVIGVYMMTITLFAP